MSRVRYLMMAGLLVLLTGCSTWYTSPGGSGTSCTSGSPCSLNEAMTHHVATGDTVDLQTGDYGDYSFESSTPTVTLVASHAGLTILDPEIRAPNITFASMGGYLFAHGLYISQGAGVVNWSGGKIGPVGCAWNTTCNPDPILSDAVDPTVHIDGVLFGDAPPNKPPPNNHTECIFAGGGSWEIENSNLDACDFVTTAQIFFTRQPGTNPKVHDVSVHDNRLCGSGAGGAFYSISTNAANIGWHDVDVANNKISQNLDLATGTNITSSNNSFTC